MFTGPAQAGDELHARGLRAQVEQTTEAGHLECPDLEIDVWLANGLAVVVNGGHGRAHEDELLPVIGAVEVVLAISFAALVFAAAALFLGWRKHRSRPVVALLGCGIVALLLARLLESAGEMVCISASVLGGALLVTGHLSNIRASRRVRAARAGR